MKNPDIDIDFADRKAAASATSAIPAMSSNDKRSIHPSGVYLQNVPINPFNDICSIDYKKAEELGYSKIDFLNQSIYTEIKDEEHLERLLATEPNWELLNEKDFVEKLPHIHSHFDVVQEIRPTSIDDLSIVLALIRPAKRHLLGLPMDEVLDEIWIQDEDKYSFKRAHSISYAFLIVLKMNLIVEELMNDDPLPF